MAKSKATRATRATKAPPKEPTTKKPDTIDLTTNTVAAAVSKASVKPTTPFTYALVLKITRDTEIELWTDTQKVEIGTFNWDEFRVRYIKTAAETPSYNYKSVIARYSLHRGSLNAKVELSNSIEDLTRFRKMEELLSHMAKSNHTWFAKIVVNLVTTPVESSSSEVEEEESEESEEEEVESHKKKSKKGSTTKVKKRKRATTTIKMEKEANKRIVGEKKDGG